MRNWLFLTLVAGFLTTAQAGFSSFNCAFPDDPAIASHQWIFTPYEVPQDGNLGELALVETMKQYAPDQVIMSGQTDIDPTFMVTKTVTNETTFTWTSYQLTLAGDATFVGTPYSDVFGLVNMPDSHNVIFSAPQSVAPGQSVTMHAFINIPDSGNFNFTMTQLAVPEPATLGLLCLGALSLRRRR